ncbi:MAG: ParB/RepB/Spo0J family partition protein [Muribaculaceae bacterium]|nr:ParB/RepB/Spo0J family partition protein [Muribaculaceae bacterium]MDE6007644.1 ParB/RepB/Spo0J family partition protein [Muribaculaceae bacterium]MDE6792018.1 ParB/RepB/Spo0J family partition protein [Muribaculaceae bacterium]
MALKRNALGRGLDSLISMTDIQTGGSSAINEIEVDLIFPNPDQPRRTFDEDTLEELASSIRELGVIQPLSLRDAGDGTYQIIAGERRWRAAKLAGIDSVPAYVRTASDSEVTEMALIENIQREDLNAIEVALAFRKLIDTYNLTQDRLSERLGKKRATIANHLRLLKLPAEIQLGLRDHKLDMGHARALLSVTDPKEQLKLYNLILKEGLSVRKVEELARGLGDPELPSAPKAPAKDNGNYDAFANDLVSYFPTPVKFSRRADGKGSITFKFTSDEELSKIVELFEKMKQ